MMFPVTVEQPGLPDETAIAPLLVVGNLDTSLRFWVGQSGRVECVFW